MPQVRLDEIKVGGRLREDVGDLQELAASIQEFGLLEPIILDRDDNLVAGMRRLSAAAILGLETIWAEYIDNITPVLAKRIELEENIRRKQLEWQEEAKATREIHRMMMEADPMWTAEKTAATLGKSRRWVFNAMELADAVETMPEVAKAETQLGAMMRLTQLKQIEERKVTAQVRVQAEAMGLKPKVSAGVLCDNALNIVEMEAESFDLVVTNPPYGVDIESVFIGDRTIYEDAARDVVPMLREVVKEVYRVLRPDRWFVFFYPTARLEEGKELLRNAGFDFQQVPCVWYKPNKYLSSLSNPYQNFSSQYETFFWARKGAPRFNKLRLGNVFVYDTPDHDDRIHPLQMPVDLWKEILEIGSVEGESVLEPFAGSGSCGVACVEQSRNYLGIELSQEYTDRANTWISEAFSGIKREASANSALPNAKIPDADTFANLGFKI